MDCTQTPAREVLVRTRRANEGPAAAPSLTPRFGITPKTLAREVFVRTGRASEGPEAARSPTPRVGVVRVQLESLALEFGLYRPSWRSYVRPPLLRIASPRPWTCGCSPR